MTYLVSINIGGNEREEYVTAANEIEAIKIVRNSLDKFEKKWANVFIG